MSNSPKKRGHPGLSRGEWLEAALSLIAEGSVADLSIEKLARSLEISKSGFYWHFNDRRELLDALLDHWQHEITEVIAKNPKIVELDAKDRLIEIATMLVDFDLTRFELAIRQWAVKDPTAARTVRQANKMRMEFVGQALSELGFKGDDLDMRTRVYVCYQTWELAMYQNLSKARRKKLIAKQVDMLIKK
jgi:AcrR family transcriptional regulator